jgi:dTDP-glucose 4,6-dehydratase
MGDIADEAAVEPLVASARFDGIINFAAETHVDRSLLEPGSFITTDVYGTYVLLEAVKRHGIPRYLQVSTDEVYGHVEDGSSVETDPIAPRSPYSASKAGGDLMVNAYHVSYGVPTLIARGSNNYGPNQYPEKFIPLCITNAIDYQPLPIYGDGRQIRDWIYAEDFGRGIWAAFEHGRLGETYNIGGGNERENIDVARQMLKLLDRPESLLNYVTDRPGHDRRYSLDTSKARTELGWKPLMSFEEGLERTVRWYQANEAWWRPIKSGEFADYYRQQYGSRVPTAG